MARKKKDKSVDVSVLADMPRVLADVAGMTFDPKDGAYVSQLDFMTIYCEGGIVLSSSNGSNEVVFYVCDRDGNKTGYIYDWYYAIDSENGEKDADGNYTSITLTLVDQIDFEEYVITTPGTYLIKQASDQPITLANGEKVTGIELTYIVGEEPTMVTIPLTDLDGQVTGNAFMSPSEGEGDGVVSVTADEDNEGLDRSGVVVFHTTKGEPAVSVARTIVQLGLREPFAGSDGDFIVADGGTFHVLK